MSHRDGCRSEEALGPAGKCNELGSEEGALEVLDGLPGRLEDMSGVRVRHADNLGEGLFG